MKYLLLSALLASALAIPTAAAFAGSGRTVQNGQSTMMPMHKSVKHHKVAGPHRQVIKPSEQH